MCLALTILAACRSGEARLAAWSKIDLESAIWAIPAARMKAKRDHRVAGKTRNPVSYQ